MCGIYCRLRFAECDCASCTEHDRAYFTRRGPDAQSEVVLSGSACGGVHGDEFPNILLAGSLLQLRGDEAGKLPVQDEAGNVLCFNGVPRSVSTRSYGD
jgi:asparagine synthetase B (glutamine-hydrolysing)